MDDRKKVNLFTIQRATKLPDRKVDKTKQMLTILGLLAIVIALPLAIFALIQPEGFFETRNQASTTYNLYGYLKSYTDSSIVTKDTFYCFADKNGNYINYNQSEKGTTYACLYKTTFNAIFNNGLSTGTVDTTKLYNILGAETGSSIDLSLPYMIITKAKSGKIAESNTAPSITLKSVDENTKLGETFTLQIIVNDTDLSIGDLIKNFEVKGFDFKVSVTTDPQFVYNMKSSFIVTIKGTAPAEKVGSTINYTINANDAIGDTGSYQGKLNVLPANQAPEIRDIVYYKNGTINTDEVERRYRLIYGESELVLGQIEVVAQDVDNTDLIYTFGALQFPFKNVKSDGNKLNFSLSWEDLAKDYQHYETNVTVSDGTKSDTETIEIIVVKAYTKYDPPICPPETTCQEWSADFDYSVKANTYQVTFNRTESTYPSNKSLSKFWWIFGDGIETYGEKTITHTYPNAGNYEATLVIEDSIGVGTGFAKTITVPSIGDLKPPYASFTAVPLVGNAPLTVRLNPSASSDQDGQIVKYSWTFGDGQTHEHNSPVSFDHTYNETGTYKVTLTVTDDTGLTASQTSTIIVGNNQTPIVTLTRPNRGIFGGTTSNPNNKINWLVVDNENNSPLFYELSLVKSQSGGTCNSDSTAGATVYKLTSGNIAYSNGAYYPNSFAWDTTKSLSGKITDGYYCVKIAVTDDTYGQMAIDFSNKPIEIVNAKHFPYITTQALPDATVGENYSTIVNAYDDDNDTLTFSLVSAPSFLTISSTGTLSGKPTESGPITVIVAVSDGTNLAKKAFTINVKAAQGQVLPAVTISINVEVFVGSNSVISWTIENGGNIGSLNIQYSKDGKTWENIVTGLTTSTNQYTWDVTNLEQGTYLIRIVYFDKNGKLLGASETKEIEIAKEETTTESEPLIYGLKPEEDSETNDTTPAISASFKASDGSKVVVNSIEVTVDGTDVTEKDSFESFEGGFAYVPAKNLTVGKHTITVKFKDEAEKSAEKTWSFKIKDVSATTEEKETKGESNIYYTAIVVILILAALVLLAYFIVKKINDERSPKKVFAPKMTQKEIIPTTQTPEQKFEEKVFLHTRAALEKDYDKLRISEQEALEQLKEKEIPKIKGDQDLTKGY